MQKINSSLNKNNYLKFVGFGFLLLGALYFLVLFLTSKQKSEDQEIILENKQENFLDKNQICKNEICFQIEQAISPQQRQKGLMFRESLDEFNGMLFVFEKEGINKFWMKNTLITLDMIRMNEDFEVIYIEENVLPCDDLNSQNNNCPSYGPENNSKYVLEINGGLSQKHSIKIGDKLQLR